MPSSAPESRQLSLPGLTMRVLHWPASEGNPAFLLLHGLASNARFWELVAPHLVEAGHPVWAPDLRGHGQTGKPDDGYDFATITRDVHEVIGWLGLERPVLVGHSWGAMVALEYAGREPEGTLSPQALALVDGGIGQVNDYPGATRETTLAALTPPRLEGTRLEGFLARLRASPRGFPIDKVRQEIILANFELRPDGTIAPNLSFDHHMALVAAMWDSPVYRWFEAVRCPVLMVPARGGDVRGVREQVYRELKERGVARASRAIRNLRVAWMDDTDHDIPLHRPEALARLLLDLAAWKPE
jgi:pimeloyl-ACP methyl ester carboxylesterase